MSPADETGPSPGLPQRSPLRKRAKLEREHRGQQRHLNVARLAIPALVLIPAAFVVAVVSQREPPALEDHQASEQVSSPNPTPVPPRTDPQSQKPHSSSEPTEDLAATDDTWQQPPEPAWRERYREAYALSVKESYVEALAILEPLIQEADSDTARSEIEGLIRYCCRVGAEKAQEQGDELLAENMLARFVALPQPNAAERATALVRLARAALHRRDLAVASDRALTALRLEPSRNDAATLVDEVAAGLVEQDQLKAARKILTAARELDPSRPAPALVIAGTCASAGRFADARRELETMLAERPDDAELASAASELRAWIQEMESEALEMARRAEEEAKLARARDIDPRDDDSDDAGTQWGRAREFRSKRFAIKSNLPSRLARWAGEQLDAAFVRLIHLLDARPPLRRARVYLFRGRRDYVSWCERNAPEFVNSGGFYDGRRRRIVIFAPANLDREILLEGLLHEVVHYSLDLALPRSPRPKWLEEGLAQHLAAALFHDTAEDVKYDSSSPPPPGADATRCRILRMPHRLLEARSTSNERWPLRDLLLCPPDRFTGDEMSSAYAEAWSFTRFLIEADASKRGDAPALAPSGAGIRAFLRKASMESLDTPEIEAAWHGF